MVARFRNRDQMHPECGSNLVKILLQILGLLVRIFDLTPNSGEDQKKIFTANWYYLHPEFWIY